MAGALRRQESEPGPRSAAGFRLARERQVVGSAVAGGMPAVSGTIVNKPTPPAGELPVVCLEAQNDWELPKTRNQLRQGAFGGMLLSGLAHLAILTAFTVLQTAPAELPRGGQEEIAIEMMVLAAEPSLATEAGAKPVETAMPEGDAIKQAVADAPPPAEPQPAMQEMRADSVDPAAVALPGVPDELEAKPAEPAVAADTAALAPAPEPVEAKVALPERPPELPPVQLPEAKPDPVAIPKTAEAEIIEALAEIAPELSKDQFLIAAQPVANPAPPPQPAPSFRTAEARVPVPVSVSKPLPRPVRAKTAPTEPAETPHKKLVAHHEPAEAATKPATPRPAKVTKPKPAEGPGRANAGAGHNAATRQASAAGGTRGTANAAGANEIASYRGTVLAHLARFKTYPDSARDADIHGRAIVSFTLTRSGGVTSVSLSGSSGAGILDAATLAMVRRAAPFPAMPAGGPASMSFTAAIRYDLR